VLCEARYTHQGKPKPLYFEENKEKFSKFLHKIEHVIVDEFPSGSNWDRENYQRSYIINGLKNANPDDIIILSDADEIVSAKTVKNYNPANGVCGVEMSLFYYKLDWRLDEKWYKARIFQFSAVGKHPLQYFRGEGDYLYNTIIPNGGWHFSFMGDKNAIKQKIQAYGHAEFNNDSFTNDKNIEESIEKGRDVFKRDLHFNKVYIDHTYPDFVKDNIRYYQNENLVSKQVLTSKFLEDCIEKAWREESKIDKEVLDLMSMSNNRIRHLFNNIGSFGNLNYLEVGCWKGGSTSSMLSNNKLNTSTIIDNFSQFLPSEENKWMGEKHPREELVDNLGKFGNDNLVKIIEQDFYTVDMNTLPPADVYFYDGGHDYESQRNALKYALPALADTFIFMVDDYHWPEVNKGTKEAVEELINSGQISCLYQRELLSFTPPKDVWPDGWQKGLTNLIGEWRNGIYIGLFKKNPSQISPKNGTNKDWTGYEKVFI
jgi:beta-1,4-mannosyl-glycoprotein beta-1,4-N-acetylglucosaminyltransferase